MFYIYWIIGASILLLLAAWLGKQLHTEFKSIFGILIDSRGRMSLNRFQIFMWTWFILSTFLAMLVVKGHEEAFAIEAHLVILMGISIASTTLGSAVKTNKNLSRRGYIKGFGLSFYQAYRKAEAFETTQPRFMQLFLEEEGEYADKVINISKYQNFIFTFVLGIAYIYLTMSLKTYPTFSEQMLWLIGISHSGYIGGKIPDKD